MGLTEETKLLGGDNRSNGYSKQKTNSVGDETDTDGELLFQDGYIDHKLVTASVCSSLVNLTNTIIGAGVLALPFAFKSTGAVLGMVVLIIVYLLIMLSFKFLLGCTKYTHVMTYDGIALEALGPKGVIISNISIFITTYGTMTSYMIIIGDMFGPLIGYWMGGTNDDYCSFFAKRQFAISMSLLIVGPLAMLRNIDSLKYTSYAAVCAVMYLLMVVVYKSGQKFKEADEREMVTEDFVTLSDQVFRAIPIITLARRVRHVTWGSLTICMLVYALIGLFGFLTFYTQDSVVQWFCNDPSGV